MTSKYKQTKKKKKIGPKIKIKPPRLGLEYVEI